MLSSLFGPCLKDAGWVVCQQRMCARQEEKARFVGIICSSGTLFTFHKDAGEVVNNVPVGIFGRDGRNSFQRFNFLWILNGYLVNLFLIAKPSFKKIILTPADTNGFEVFNEFVLVHSWWLHKIIITWFLQLFCYYLLYYLINWSPFKTSALLSNSIQ